MCYSTKNKETNVCEEVQEVKTTKNIKKYLKNYLNDIFEKSLESNK